jgi:Zn-dependent protease
LSIAISLAVHEAAHLFTAIILGIKFKRVKITLFGFNLNADLEGISLVKKIILFLSGPLCNYAVYYYFRDSHYTTFAEINIFLSLVNMAPVIPLDGGNICKSFLDAFLDPAAACRYIIMTNSFFIVCFLVLIYIYEYWIFFLLVIMGLRGIIDEYDHYIGLSIKRRYTRYIG